MRDRIKNEPEASGLETFMRIAVVGSGYVGLVAGACFADMGHEVILVDNDQQKLAALKADRFPFTSIFCPNCCSGIADRSCSSPTICMQAAQGQHGDFCCRGNTADR